MRSLTADLWAFTITHSACCSVQWLHNLFSNNMNVSSTHRASSKLDAQGCKGLLSTTLQAARCPSSKGNPAVLAARQ